jgi:1-deoxy-D-xylulose-5-phosphate synthase
MSILSSISSPEDVKKLSYDELKSLAQEIRKKIIAVTAQNGGHVGPNLGVVEMTMALHRVFDSPKDKFVFDVAHQGYVHKLLTGRNDERFDKIRLADGLSGFLSRDESPYDCYGAGHAGTCLSAALGMATARDIASGDEHVIAVCGDAAFTCGITLEALNNIKASTKRLIVILNDNEWSIAKNVGAISKYLSELIKNPIYNRLNDDVEQFLQMLPGGESLIRMGSKAKKEAKDFFVPSSLFENLGLRYVGPIDGHNQEELESYLEFAKESPEPIILHVQTTKGKGYDIAINNPEHFHGASPYDVNTGKSVGGSSKAPKYQDVFGETLSKLALEDERIIGITAAMPSGTGLNIFAKKVPDRFYDVGIAEEHAVLFAAGLATRGLKPVCGIYSTFLQRAFDPIMHDVNLQNLPVLFCMDRAGLSPNDGATHHGLFDISYLRCLPRSIIMAPSNEDEMADMIKTGIDIDGPAFIRYPRGNGTGLRMKDSPESLPIGKAQVLKDGDQISIWAIGVMVEQALIVANKLEELGLSVTVVNARFAKPLDETLLLEHAEKHSLIVTLEDHVITGGFGSAVLETLNANRKMTPVEIIGWPDQFIPHGDNVEQLRSNFGLSEDQIYQKIQNYSNHLKLQETSKSVTT